MCIYICVRAVEANAPEGTPVTMPEPRCLEVSVAHSRFGVAPFTEARPKKGPRDSRERFLGAARKREGLLILCGIAAPLSAPVERVCLHERVAYFLYRQKHTSSVDSARLCDE